MLWVKNNKDWFGSGKHLVILMVKAEEMERLIFFWKTYKITENLIHSLIVALKRDLCNVDEK